MSTTREESLLNAIAEGGASGVKPYTREEKFLAYIAGETAEKPIAYTRKEKLLEKIAENGAGGGGGGAAKEEQEKTVTITENGTTEVTPDEGKTLSKVTVETSVLAGGEPGKPYIDTSKITDFSYFCRSNRMNDFIDYIDTSKGTDFSHMFSSCHKITRELRIDTSKGENFSDMFVSSGNIPSVYIDTSNGTNFNRTFSYCSNLETVSITTAKSNFQTSTFQNCTGLKNLTIGEGWNVNIYLNYSNNLTVESLHGMIENLADLTGQTAKKFQIGSTNIAKLDEEHYAMLEAKNWEVS